MLISPHMRLTYRGRQSITQTRRYHALDRLAQLALTLRQSELYGYGGQ